MEIMSPNMTTVYGDGEDGGELILAGLIKFKKYTIAVQAFNEVGNGPLSEPTQAQTMEDGTATSFPSVRPLITTIADCIEYNSHGRASWNTSCDGLILSADR